MFWKLFSKNFSKNLFLLSAVLEAKAGAKISHIFETSKCFGNFFFKNLLKNLSLRLSADLSS